MTAKRAFVTVSALTLLTLILAAAGVRLESQSEHATFSPPGYWVPFAAELVTVRDGSESVGHYYRRSDGSTATVLSSEGGAVVTIHNHRTGFTYIRFGDAEGWVRHPLDRSQRERRPMPTFRVRRDLFRTVPETVAGGPVYESTARDGTVTRLAIGLNALPIYSGDAEGRNARVYRNIVVGEPPDEVFQPPPGIVIRDVPSMDLRRPRQDPQRDPHRR
jgi:hypothetical protein